MYVFCQTLSDVTLLRVYNNLIVLKFGSTLKVTLQNGADYIYTVKKSNIHVLTHIKQLVLLL